MWRFYRVIMSCLSVALFAACSRSATEAAIQVSGLPIPERAKVLRFIDSAGGMVGEDLTLIIEMELTAAEFRRVEDDARVKGYIAVRRPFLDDSIPVDFIDGKPNMPKGFGAAVRELQPGASGLFLGKGSVSNGSVVTLDPSRRRVVIATWIL